LTENTHRPRARYVSLEAIASVRPGGFRHDLVGLPARSPQVVERPPAPFAGECQAMARPKPRPGARDERDPGPQSSSARTGCRRSGPARSQNLASRQGGATTLSFLPTTSADEALDHCALRERFHTAPEPWGGLMYMF